jgi:hypothetical protein
MAQDFQTIRLLFPVPAHEKAAVRLLRALAVLVGDYADQVRPETKVEEIMARAEAGGADTVEFITALEAGIGMEADSLADGFEQMTFREVVEVVCEREP